MKPKTKQVIFMAVWFGIYISAKQFLRFKFGVFEISAAWVAIGIPLYWFFCMRRKPN
jgi:hypothetical protein